MSVDSLSRLIVRGGRLPAIRSRRLAVPLPAALGVVVAGSFVVRLAASLARATPVYFPDEYIYSSLARSIARSGSLTIRGAPAHFPALLEPLLAAPFWLGHDETLVYHLTLGLHALAMSLAAVPAAWLSRRLGLAYWPSLACAAFAVTLPDLLYVNYVTADAVAYPLALAGIAAAVATIDRPTRRAQLALVTFSALATLARLQYVVIPAVFLAAALVVERGRVSRVAKTYPVALTLFALPLAAIAASGPSHALGYYSLILHSSVDPTRIAHWIAVDSMLLVYAAGVVLVPGAVLGVVAGAARPRTRGEAAFAWVSLAFVAALLLEAGLYAANGSLRFQERYLFSLLPLVPIGFALGLRRRRLALPVAGLAVGFVLLALRVPLSGYTYGTGKQDSPMLQAWFRVEQLVGSYGTGSLVAVTVVAALAIVAAVAAFRPRLGLLLALPAALVVTALASAAAVTYNDASARRAVRTFLPSDYSFAERARPAPTSVLVLPRTPRPVVSEHLFWNPSLENVLLYPGAAQPDSFGSALVRIAPDGTIVDRGRVVRGPLLIEQYTALATLADARAAVRTRLATVWIPDGTPRLSTLIVGRYFDGWLSPENRVVVWPDASGRVSGTLHLTLSLPRGAGRRSVELRAQGLRRRVEVRPGRTTKVAIPVHAGAKWTLRIGIAHLFLVPGDRAVSVRARPPVFVRATPSSPGR